MPVLSKPEESRLYRALQEQLNKPYPTPSGPRLLGPKDLGSLYAPLQDEGYWYRRLGVRKVGEAVTTPPAPTEPPKKKGFWDELAEVAGTEVMSPYYAVPKPVQEKTAQLVEGLRIGFAGIRPGEERLAMPKTVGEWALYLPGWAGGQAAALVGASALGGSLPVRWAGRALATRFGPMAERALHGAATMAAFEAGRGAVRREPPEHLAREAISGGVTGVAFELALPQLWRLRHLWERLRRPVGAPARAS